MADVAESFFRGIAAGHAQKAHEQQLAENKLRMQLLKHQMDRIKLEDQLRTRELQKENFALLHGQPEADLPTEPVTQQNLPTERSYAGAQSMPDLVGGLIRERMGGFAPTPTQMAAPDAQATTPGTNDLARRTAAVQIPGVAELGVPGVSVRPQSMEDLLRMSIAAKSIEPFNLGPDQTRFVGGREVAHGRPRTVAPTRASIALDAAGGNATKADESLRSQTATRAPVQTDVLLDGAQTKVLFHPPTKSDPARYTDLDGAPIENASTRIRPLRTSDGSRANPDTEARMQYQEFFKVYNRSYPAPSAQERANAQLMGEELKPAAPAPPSFEKWKVMTPEERQGVLANPAARITDEEMSKRAKSAPSTAAKPDAKSTSVPPAVATALKGKKPNTRYKLTDGSVWDVLADGSIRPGPKP